MNRHQNEQTGKKWQEMHSQNDEIGARTKLTEHRYQRISGLYDGLDWILEYAKYDKWREALWLELEGRKILEVGIGTGKNIPYHPNAAEITGIDLTPGMLRYASKRAKKYRSDAKLSIGDVQNLEFEDNGFDSAVATFVFCSVPDPVKGLSELRRVVKPGGEVYLLEHRRSPNERIARVMDWMDPYMCRIYGAHINRRTVENVEKSGLRIVSVENLWLGGIFCKIIAKV